MKITFLGTSDGKPDAKRYCSSTMIEVGESVYFIDAGAPLADLVVRMGIPYEKVKAIFNTHFHADHIFGVIHFLSLATWCYRNSKFDVFTPSERGIEAIKQVVAADCEGLPADRIRLVKYDETLCYKDENIEVTAIPTNHIPGSSYSFIVKAEGKKLMFSGDFNANLEDFPKVLYNERFDLFVAECAHFSFEALKEKLVGVQCDKVLVNHIFPPEIKEKEIEAAKPEFSFELGIARDGDIIEY